ncbi:MAG: PorT family protein, partial [Chitinophagaceae bacterium]|nr:PorT family protein [Chitinophagaceae bacterium]
VTGFSQINKGISAGLSNTRWKGDAMTNFGDLLDVTNGMVTTQPVNGIYAGGFVEVPLGGRFSVQPGIYYTQKGYKMQAELTGKNTSFLNAGATATMRSHYIDLPVVLKAEVAKGLQIFAGPQVSYLVKNNLNVDAGLLGISLFKRNVDITDQFNKVDLGLTGGASYTFENGFFITATYDHGLTSLDKNNRTEAFNRGYKVGIGYRF